MLGSIIDAAYEPIAVPANIENMFVTDDIGGAESLLQIVEALIGAGLD
jgi:hypothetical protein